MLASFGRVAAQRLASRRIAASASGYSVRVGHLAAHQPSGSSALLGAVFAKRTYVAGRPKKTAADSTATATKAKAKPRKTAAAAAPTKKAAAPKKKTTKAKAAASKTKKKPAVDRRRKKAVSPERKAKEKLAAQKKLWKEKAMLNSEPKKLPTSAWQVYIAEALHGLGAGELMVDRMPKISATFKSLPSVELQKLEDIAEQNKVKNEAQYKAWVVSHTPAQIADAVRARILLKSKFGLPKARQTWVKIQDDRQPKKPLTPYFHFSRSKHGSGEFADLSMIDKQKAIAVAWNRLSPAEQQPFIDLAEADKSRYNKEAQAVGLRTTQA